MTSTWNFVNQAVTTFAGATLTHSKIYTGTPGSVSLSAAGFHYPDNSPVLLASGNYGPNDMGLGVDPPTDKEINPQHYVQLDLANIQSHIVQGSQCQLRISSAEQFEGFTPGWSSVAGQYGAAGSDVVNPNPGFYTNWNFDPTVARFLSARGVGVGGANMLLFSLTCCLSPGSQVVGDPQFVGLRGQSYQVHGVSGEVYNIVSDSDLQYNSRFVFLDSGECPVINGRKQKNCWSHPGSFLGQLGLKTRAGDRVEIHAGPAKVGFDMVTVNGKELALGDVALLADDMGTISRNTTHSVEAVVGNWMFAFENSDRFVNQRIRIVNAQRLRSHGLVGQTWRETTYKNAI